MDEQIKEWCDEYGFASGVLSGYRGGYPIVEFTIEKESKIYRFKSKDLDKFVRKAEMSAGMQMGVGLNFRKTAFINLNGEKLFIGGHALIIDKVLKSIFNS